MNVPFILKRVSVFMSMARVINTGKFPLHQVQKKILKKYLKSFPHNGNDVLFTNRKGEPLTRQGIRYIMQKYVAESRKSNQDNFSGTAHPHLLRHSKATHLVNAGVNIYIVRDFLGHASVATT